ncbi:fructosamine kinase family protein [Xylocopilactobacillus apicola]|uniref:Fructosamine-3-kinase n=1 Tax=Xylocopilactobacillus apicola TaxID=2932184 RepID=A0AAU9DA28_9LACO|nr:fructosamine kinase family protein [Xylocopilactobacillus apicola]BDR58360.1 fructosamine-3-kinase [Xylocopilactobacillus apicola]
MNDKWLNQLPIGKIVSGSPVGGGDVNQAYHLRTQADDYFLLVQPGKTGDFYASEIAGLKELAEANISAPKVLGNGEIDGSAYLLLNFLDRGQGSQRDLGQLVAKLHQHFSLNGQFGFQTPYQGSDLSFDNSWTDSWSEIFVNRRLDYLKDLIISKHHWSQSDLERYQAAREVIIAELSKHQSEPSLLHGDLWGGNYIFLTDGQPVLIDPDCLYGDREFDLGITTVFGGFTFDFYEAYQELFPLDDGYQFRLNFYRLYYLMVHLNKFGLDYASSVRTALNKIIQ